MWVLVMFEFKADAQMYYDKVTTGKDDKVRKPVYTRRTERKSGIVGVSDYHVNGHQYWRASIAVVRHTVKKDIAKSFKTLEEAMAQRQEWETVRDILKGDIVWVTQEEWDMVYASKYWEVYHGMAQEQDEDYGM